jgi:hypothetical protein
LHQSPLSNMPSQLPTAQERFREAYLLLLLAVTTSNRDVRVDYRNSM